MKRFQNQPTIVSIALAGALLLTIPRLSLGETASREKAQLILDEVKQRKLEGQIKAKQTELQRLDEDHAKRQEEAENLQTSIEKIAAATSEAGSSLDRLTAERKRLTDLLELTNQRIEAERLKLDGLKVLNDAQSKARDLALRQSEETSLRSGIGKAELQLLSDKQAPMPDLDGANAETGKLANDVGELKRKLLKSERATLNAGKSAREAMLVANEKLLQADKADAKAKKTATSLGQEEVPGTATVPERLDPIAAPPAPEKKP